MTPGPAIDTEEFSAMVGRVYDAAVDPQAWRPALWAIRDFVRGRSATLFSKDVLTQTGGVVYDDGGIEQHYIRTYFEHFIHLDPASAAQYYAPVGEPMGTADLLPYDEFLTSRFYREWARPQGLVDFVSVALEKSSTAVVMFGVFRHREHGLVDEAARQRMRLVAPHLRRAVSVGRLLERSAAVAADLAGALDGLPTAVLLLDAAGHLQHANAAGHALLARSTVLQVEHGRLVAASPSAATVLAAPSAAGQIGDGAPLSLGRDGDLELVAHTLPLTASRRLAGTGAAMALLVSPAATLFVAAPERIARQYGLTPSELRILLAIAEIGGVPSVAKALGLRQSTVKFHLKNLFLKTGVHRQAGLVKLLAEARSPLV